MLPKQSKDEPGEATKQDLGRRNSFPLSKHSSTDIANNLKSALRRKGSIRKLPPLPEQGGTTPDPVEPQDKQRNDSEASNKPGSSVESHDQKDKKQDMEVQDHAPKVPEMPSIGHTTEAIPKNYGATDVNKQEENASPSSFVSNMKDSENNDRQQKAAKHEGSRNISSESMMDDSASSATQKTRPSAFSRPVKRLGPQKMEAAHSLEDPHGDTLSRSSKQIQNLKKTESEYSETHPIKSPRSPLVFNFHDQYTKDQKSEEMSSPTSASGRNGSYQARSPSSTGVPAGYTDRSPLSTPGSSLSTSTHSTYRTGSGHHDHATQSSEPNRRLQRASLARYDSFDEFVDSALDDDFLDPVDNQSMGNKMKRPGRKHSSFASTGRKETQPSLADLQTDVDTEIDLQYDDGDETDAGSVHSHGRCSACSRSSSRASVRSSGSRRLNGAVTRKISPAIIHMETITKEPERMFKVVLAGDAAVGKSSFILRLCKNKFVNNLNSTLGVDFQTKTIESDGRVVALQLWDTAGQERYRSVARSYYKRCDGVLLLYSCVNEQTFVNVRAWVSAVEESADKKLPIMFVANKTDLRDEFLNDGRKCIKCVSSEDGRRLAREYDGLFIETSAKHGDNILEAVTELARLMRANEDLEVHNVGLHLQETSNTKNKILDCCSL